MQDALTTLKITGGIGGNLISSAAGPMALTQHDGASIPGMSYGSCLAVPRRSHARPPSAVMLPAAPLEDGRRGLDPSAVERCVNTNQRGDHGATSAECGSALRRGHPAARRRSPSPRPQRRTVCILAVHRRPHRRTAGTTRSLNANSGALGLHDQQLRDECRQKPPSAATAASGRRGSPDTGPARRGGRTSARRS